MITDRPHHLILQNVIKTNQLIDLNFLFFYVHFRRESPGRSGAKWKKVRRHLLASSSNIIYRNVEGSYGLGIADTTQVNPGERAGHEQIVGDPLDTVDASAVDRHPLARVETGEVPDGDQGSTDHQEHLWSPLSVPADQLDRVRSFRVAQLIAIFQEDHASIPATQAQNCSVLL